MMNTILSEIVDYKKQYVAEKKSLIPIRLLEQSVYFESKSVSLKKYILREDKHGIIAEIKRKSPSKGVINRHVSVEQLSIGYMQAGASALSVLTDEKYFGGSLADLKTARKYNFCPILRKEFIVDEYQLIEAKSAGADAVLLIASILSRQELKDFITTAHGLGMEVLMEIHDESELNKIEGLEMDCVGINNRNLKTFDVNLENSILLAEKIPSNVVKVAESGISSPEVVKKLRQHGFDGFLIGQAFMQESSPEIACKNFINSLNN